MPIKLNIGSKLLSISCDGSTKCTIALVNITHTTIGSACKGLCAIAIAGTNDFQDNEVLCTLLDTDPSTSTTYVFELKDGKAAEMCQLIESVTNAAFEALVNDAQAMLNESKETEDQK